CFSFFFSSRRRHTRFSRDWSSDVCSSDLAATGLDLDRRAFALRKRVEHETAAYFPSLSSRTVVYKGMLTTSQLEPFFPDLSDPRSEERRVGTECRSRRRRAALNANTTVLA